MAKRSNQELRQQELSRQEPTAQVAVPQSVEEGILSAITNAVCPHCGGAMLGFQCLGECRRDWHDEWAAVQTAAPPPASKRRVQ